MAETIIITTPMALEEIVFKAVEKAIRIHLIAAIKVAAPEPEDLISISEAAKLLRLTEKTIYNKVNKGEMPFKKNGKRLIFSRKELRDWLDNK